MKRLDVLENKTVYERETEVAPLRGVAIGDPKRGVEPSHYTTADFDESDSPDAVWYTDHEWLRKLLGYCESKEIYWWTAWCWCPR